MTKKDYDVNLDDLWEKLNNVCQKVWDEDRVSAVALQAVVNEIKIGFRRAEEIITSLRQELGMREAALRHECDKRIAEMEEKISLVETERAGFERELNKSKVRTESLMKELETKEEENAGFQERYLKIEAQKDSQRAAHMEEFIAEMNTKEREREFFWKQRQQTLEVEFKQRETELEQRYRSLMEEMKQSAEETRKLHLQKEAELMETQKQIQAEFQNRENSLRERERECGRKMEELEKLKENLRKEIAELTKQYQPKTNPSTHTQP